VIYDDLYPEERGAHVPLPPFLLLLLLLLLLLIIIIIIFRRIS
jgi:hypothetical protein